MTRALSKIKFISFFTLIAVFLSASVSANQYKLQGLSREKNHQGLPWFRMVAEEKVNSVTTSFIASDGRVLSQEKVLHSNDRTEYFWVQNQINKKVTLTLLKDKVIFNQTDEIAISKKDQAKTVLPPMIFSFLQKNIKARPMATSFPITIVIPDKEILVDFTFQKEDRFWILKADQFFIRLVIKPVKFLLGDEGQLKEIQDILPPVQFETKSKALETKITDILFF